jgi:hypothetical protein
MDAIYTVENGAKMAYQLGDVRVVVAKGGKAVTEFKYQGEWKVKPRALARHQKQHIERLERLLKQD